MGHQCPRAVYKVHLDGYNQMDLITGTGPSKRNEIFYFAKSTLGAVRIGDFKYRFIDQPKGRFGGRVKVDWPILVNLRLNPFEGNGNATRNLYVTLKISEWDTSAPCRPGIV